MFRTTISRALHYASPCATRSSLGLSARILRNEPRNSLSKYRNFSSTRTPGAIHYVRFGGGANPGKKPHGPIKKEYIIGLGVIGGIYYVSHLEQVPETGRWRFMNIGPKTEDRIGRMAREDILQEYDGRIVPPNHVISRHVRRVITQILSANNLGHIRGESNSFVPPSSFGEEASWDPDVTRGSEGKSGLSYEKEWEVVVVHDPKIVNAMATPGMIVVFTGILPVCKDEQGLAAVLAHEIGHVVARHTAERISSQTIIWLLLSAAAVMGFDWGLSNLAQSLLYELPNSRTQELEADKIGLKLMSRACFDPQGSVDMFGRLTRLQQEKSRIDFFNTHPSGTKRAEELSKLLPEAYDTLNANPDCAALRDRFHAFREVSVRGLDF